MVVAAVDGIRLVFAHESHRGGNLEIGDGAVLGIVEVLVVAFVVLRRVDYRCLGRLNA